MNKTIQVDQAEWQAFKSVCAKNGVTMTSAIREFIKKTAKGESQ